jgi:hypothetical protein
MAVAAKQYLKNSEWAHKRLQGSRSTTRCMHCGALTGMAYWFFTFCTTLKMLQFCRFRWNKGQAATSMKCTQHVWIHVLAKFDIVVSFLTAANVPKVAQHSPILLYEIVSTNPASHSTITYIHIPRCPIAGRGPRHCSLQQP